MKYYPPRFLFRRYEILRRVRKADNFLEIGPGNLHLATDLLRYFKKGTLIDYNTDTQKIYNNLSKAFRERLDLIIADFSSTTLSQTKYDCIIACEVMEHVENDEDFLSKICDLLDSRGQLILSVPSRMKFWSKHDEIVGHLRRYEKEDMVNILSRQNLENIKVISYGFPFVNLLRLPRIFLAKLQYEEKALWSQERQTQQSGIVQTSKLIGLVSLVCNQYTFYPLSLFSSLFSGHDLSDGYVITAEKR